MDEFAGFWSSMILDVYDNSYTDGLEDINLRSMPGVLPETKSTNGSQPPLYLQT